MVQDDYPKVSIVHTLLLIALMVVVGEVLSRVIPGAAQNLSALVWWAYLFAAVGLFFIAWPIICRRFNDLSGHFSAR